MDAGQPPSAGGVVCRAPRPHLRSMSTDATTPRRITVNCPTCQGPALFAPENRWRPFCSERCRMIDLGAWANDEYVVPGQPVEADDDIPPEGMRH